MYAYLIVGFDHSIEVLCGAFHGQRRHNSIKQEAAWYTSGTHSRSPQTSPMVTLPCRRCVRSRAYVSDCCAHQPR